MTLRPASALLCFCLAPAFVLAGCSGADAPADAGTEASTQAGTESSIREALEAEGRNAEAFSDGFEELAWEDLMPEGEVARLEALYANFYDDLEDRLRATQTLVEAGQEEQDVSTLIAEGSADDSMEQIGTFNTVADLDGARVRLPGYVVPFDFSADAEHSEFLLVPYFGACLHTPPPPPNQMLFVKASPPAKIDDIYEPVWLEGTLSTGRFDSDLGNSAYRMTLSSLTPYEY